MQSMTSRDTHGLVTRPGCTVTASSLQLGWTSLFASEQRESPFEARLAPARDHLLVLHLGGTARVSASAGGERACATVSPGAIYLWPAGHGFELALEHRVETIHVYVRSELVDQHAGALHKRALRGIQLAPEMHIRDLLLEQLVLEVRRLVSSADGDCGDYAEVLAHAIAARLVVRQSARLTTASTASSTCMPPHQLDRVVAFIDESIDRPVSLSELSEVLGLSVSHFVRRFTRTVGCSPYKFVIQRRLERAKRLLEMSDESLVSIALECGFAHQEHFTNTFKRATGTTPGAYRKRFH